MCYSSGCRPIHKAIALSNGAPETAVHECVAVVDRRIARLAIGGFPDWPIWDERLRDLLPKMEWWIKVG